MNNKKVADFDLKGVLDLAKADIMQTLNCHAVARVVSFDPAAQTVVAELVYQKLVGDEFVKYPLLVDCPVVIMAGGDGALTMPISAGDSCLVLFCDRDIDNWYAGATEATPLASGRTHSFSDAVALIGIRSTQNVIPDYDVTRVSLRHGEAVVALGESLIKIANDVTSLKAVINGLIDVIKGLTTASFTDPNSPPGTPYVNTGLAISAAGQTALNNYKTTVGGLLE